MIMFNALCGGLSVVNYGTTADILDIEIFLNRL